MLPQIKYKKKIEIENQSAFILSDIDQLEEIELKDADKDFVFSKLEEKPLKWVVLSKLHKRMFFVLSDESLDLNKHKEKFRRLGYELNQALNAEKESSVSIVGLCKAPIALALAEGLAMSNYQFLKYFSNKNELTNSLRSIKLFAEDLTKKEVTHLSASLEGNFVARDLVNEPLSYLTAEQLSEEIAALGKNAGFTVDIFNKKKIEALKMGGLLAVNRGAPNPPTFNIMEWHSPEAKNDKPILLVGKGVVYDTGGLSLKPTANSMDFMKSDMAGAAAVVGTMYAIAKAKLPVHVVGLVPATENRPDGNAYAPGDVVTMFNKMTVEVLNTDAEGRMILADALSYGQKYKPELCFDLATLTGAAAAAVSDQAVVVMGTAKQKVFEKLATSGFEVQERTAQLPFFDEYQEYLKSDIADMKNIGGPYAGSITAGKFLEYFTLDDKKKHAYPWIHIDIAGPAFLKSPDTYRGKNASGVGVRLLFDFLANY